MPAKGVYLAIAGGGAILLWSGIRGKSWSSVIRNVVSGQDPKTALNINPIQTASTPATGPGSGTGSGQVFGYGIGQAHGTNQKIVQKVATIYGWGGGQQWQCLVNLLNKESGFNNTAQNPTSTAYGIFQFLDTTWATVGGSKTSDPTQQSVLGMKYIQGRYGSPCGAWAHEVANNWY